MREIILEVPTFVKYETRLPEYAIVRSHAFRLSVLRIKKILKPNTWVISMRRDGSGVLMQYNEQVSLVRRKDHCINFIKEAIFNELDLYARLPKQYYNLLVEDPSVRVLIETYLINYKALYKECKHHESK